MAVYGARIIVDMFTGKHAGIEVSTKKLILAMLMLIVLLAGCAPTSIEPLSSTPAPPASTYPADISGRVTIAKKVKCLTAIPVPPNRDTDVFWIVDISVKNNAYSDSVKADFQMGYSGWVISANDKVYMPVGCGSRGENPPIDLTVGQTGKFMLHFSVPQTLQISDAQICYKGQEPYSYGKLTGGDKVAAYDWYLKMAVPEEANTPNLLLEQYVVFDGPLTGSHMQNLKTIGSWNGSTSRTLEFSTNKSPVVINFGYTRTSQIKSSLDISFQGPPEGYYPQIGSNFWQTVLNNGEILEGTGRYVIKVTASGCDWWIKVGVE